MPARRAQFLTSKMMLTATKNAFLMLTPATQIKNPVIFVTYLSAIATSLCVLSQFFFHTFSWFDLQITLWLWFTVLFANFAESIAESRGKTQVLSLKKTKIEAYARQEKGGVEWKIPCSLLKKREIILCEAGDIIPADGEVIEGVASVDESAITGESAPVIRESGEERSAVTAGTKILTDRLKIRITSEPGHSFLDQMIQLIESAKRQRTPNEIALHILLSALTILFLFTTGSLKVFGDFSAAAAHQDLSHVLTIPILVALLVCLIPTTIGALLSAVGIAGMDRLIQCNVVAMSGRAI